jgi:hypothetical protein
MTRKRDVASALGEIEARLDSDELLSAEDKAQILEKAREHVAKQRKEKAEEAFLAKAIREEERSYNPVDKYEDVLIDLAPFAPYISLDGVMYFHGLTYSVTYGVARTIDDISGRTWEHQNEIDGHRRKGDLNRRPLNRRISPRDVSDSRGAVNTRQSVLSSVNENTAI